MAASLPPTDKIEEIAGRIFRDEQQQTETVSNFLSAATTLLLHHCDGHLEPESLLGDIKSCSDCESKILNQRVSFLSAAIHLKSSPWGWIIAYRQPYHKWTESETNFLHQVSNQISLAISHATLIEKKLKREAQVKAIEETNRTKGQILANTSHGKEDRSCYLCQSSRRINSNYNFLVNNQQNFITCWEQLLERFPLLKEHSLHMNNKIWLK